MNWTKNFNCYLKFVIIIIFTLNYKIIVFYDNISSNFIDIQVFNCEINWKCVITKMFIQE